jgi:membrane associated rhomboid family serine protease
LEEGEGSFDRCGYHEVLERLVGFGWRLHLLLLTAHLEGLEMTDKLGTPLGGQYAKRRYQTLTVRTTVHRLNLFPVMHLNFFHMIFNLLAVTPLIERFESEYGTLVTLALFTGRKRTCCTAGRQ